MYGLVNRAVEGLLRREHGDAVWETVRRRAGVSDAGFQRMKTYDDAVTVSLVAAASEELDISAADLLRAFGQYWVTYVADEGYGPMLTMAGSTLEEFLDQLDAMHARVGLTYRELRPPSFKIERQDGRLLVHYHSNREGLGPMVVGLLEGLIARFGEAAEVRVLEIYGEEVFEIVRHT